MEKDDRLGKRSRRKGGKLSEVRVFLPAIDAAQVTDATSESTCDQTCSASPTTTASALQQGPHWAAPRDEFRPTPPSCQPRLSVRDLVGAAGLDGHGGDADQIDTGVV